MAQGLSKCVPGPSLLLKEWPWDNQNVSQVHISDNNYVPGPVIYCPRACYLLSLVHYCCLKNVPGTIKLCPRSMFLMINMSQGLLFIVPGPSLLLEECPWNL